MSSIAYPQQVASPEGRVTAYRVLATLLARELTNADIHSLSALAESTAYSDCADAPDGLATALARLAETLPAEGDADALLDLAAEYARLFLGAGGPPVVPPFESFYSGAARLYGPASLEIRTLLDRWRVSYPVELGPEDHLVVELLLAAALADRALHSGAEPEAADLLACQRELVGVRLAGWFPAFAERVEAHTRSAFYGALVEVIGRFLHADAEYLRAVVAQ